MCLVCVLLKAWSYSIHSKQRCAHWLSTHALFISWPLSLCVHWGYLYCLTCTLILYIPSITSFWKMRMTKTMWVVKKNLEALHYKIKYSSKFATPICNGRAWNVGALVWSSMSWFLCLCIYEFIPQHWILYSDWLTDVLWCAIIFQ